jgi:hypothetical protein
MFAKYYNVITRTYRTHWEIRNAYKPSVGKPEGKRRLGRRRQESDIKMVLMDVDYEGMNWILISSF